MLVADWKHYWQDPGSLFTCWLEALLVPSFDSTSIAWWSHWHSLQWAHLIMLTKTNKQKKSKSQLQAFWCLCTASPLQLCILCITSSPALLAASHSHRLEMERSCYVIWPFSQLMQGRSLPNHFFISCLVHSVFFPVLCQQIGKMKLAYQIRFSSSFPLY